MRRWTYARKSLAPSQHTAIPDRKREKETEEEQTVLLSSAVSSHRLPHFSSLPPALFTPLIVAGLSACRNLQPPSQSVPGFKGKVQIAVSSGGMEDIAQLASVKPLVNFFFFLTGQSPAQQRRQKTSAHSSHSRFLTPPPVALLADAVVTILACSPERITSHPNSPNPLIRPKSHGEMEPEKPPLSRLS
ncbi:hypothetical protein Q8A67_024128 [Cirrhinus molitorella]|uniref:Uncharacterized protein n=1 Tax=Cirrhinus molitorella TaxID=172907 RepID=A0AA88NY04_9TELE|nr:hypothetical protein Q8A67_024128 [Cirrhinus molitorella]